MEAAFAGAPGRTGITAIIDGEETSPGFSHAPPAPLPNLRPPAIAVEEEKDGLAGLRAQIPGDETLAVLRLDSHGFGVGEVRRDFFEIGMIDQRTLKGGERDDWRRHQHGDRNDRGEPPTLH